MDSIHEISRTSFAIKIVKSLLELLFRLLMSSYDVLKVTVELYTSLLWDASPLLFLFAHPDPHALHRIPGY